MSRKEFLRSNWFDITWLCWLLERSSWEANWFGITWLCWLDSLDYLLNYKPNSGITPLGSNLEFPCKIDLLVVTIQLKYILLYIVNPHKNYVLSCLHSNLTCNYWSYLKNYIPWYFYLFFIDMIKFESTTYILHPFYDKHSLTLGQDTNRF